MNAVLHHALDPFTAGQDYAWFIAWLAWAGVLATIWPKARAQDERLALRWLKPMAWAELATATGAILQHVSPPRDPWAPERIWETLAALATLTQTSVWVWYAVRPKWRGGLARGMILALFAVTVWQLLQPVEPGKPEEVRGGLLVLVAATASAIVLGARHPPAIRAALAIHVVGLSLSPFGAWAVWAHEGRRWVDLSLFSVPCALISALAGALFLRAVIQAAERNPPQHTGDWKRLTVKITVCLATGIAVAEWMGRQARHSFETGLMARAQAFAAVVDTRALRDWLDQRFVLGERLTNAQFFGGTIELYRAPAINDPSIAPTRAFLGRLEEINPDVRNVHISTLKNGDLVLAAAGKESRGPQDTVPRHRSATAEDLKAWQEKKGLFSPPFMSAWGALVRASAPLVDEHQRMLGWLALDVGVPQWAAVQAQARLQSFALTALGIVLLLMAEEQRRRTEDRAAAQTEARAARAADQAKSAFLAQVSHELRTPLQSILGFGELLRGTSLDGRQERWLERLTTHGSLLIRLVDDLLDLTSQQAGMFRIKAAPGDIAGAVADAVESMRPRADAKRLHLTLGLDVPPDTRATFDAERVRQVIQNLVGNALKFTQRGGVDVVFKALHEADVLTCELRVRDTGPGIAGSEQNQLFRPFARTGDPARHEGLGLGLALSRGICRAMRGDVTLERSAAPGSEFVARWTLEYGRQEKAIAPSEAKPVLVPTAAGRSFLVADDNALVRELFVEFLRAHGADVDTAADGEEALSCCGRKTYDAVALDLSMPRLDGLTLAERLKSRGYAARLVVVSARTSSAEEHRAFAAGADAFLSKPVVLAELLCALVPHVQPTSVTEPESLRELRIHMRRQFAAEVREQIERLVRACDAADWISVVREVHHLKNSADVVQLPRLSRVCEQLEILARAGDAGVTDTLCHLQAEVAGALAG